MLGTIFGVFFTIFGVITILEVVLAGIDSDSVEGEAYGNLNIYWRLGVRLFVMLLGSASLVLGITLIGWIGG